MGESPQPTSTGSGLVATATPPRTTYRFIFPVEVVVDIVGSDSDENEAAAEALVREASQTWSAEDDRVTLGIGSDVPEPFEVVRLGEVA